MYPKIDDYPDNSIITIGEKTFIKSNNNWQRIPKNNKNNKEYIFYKYIDNLRDNHNKLYSKNHKQFSIYILDEEPLFRSNLNSPRLTKEQVSFDFINSYKLLLKLSNNISDILIFPIAIGYTLSRGIKIIHEMFNKTNFFYIFYTIMDFDTALITGKLYLSHNLDKHMFYIFKKYVKKYKIFSFTNYKEKIILTITNH